MHGARVVFCVHVRCSLVVSVSLEQLPKEVHMGGALQGTGLSSIYPVQQIPWGWNPQFSGQTGAIPPFGMHVPQQQSLQAVLQQLLQLGVVQQQQVQQLLQILPQQLQQIQHLIQFVAQQTYQQQSYQTPLHYQQSFFPTAGFGMSPFGAPANWLGTSQGSLPQIFTGQGGIGQSGYVM